MKNLIEISVCLSAILVLAGCNTSGNAYQPTSWNSSSSATVLNSSNGNSVQIADTDRITYEMYDAETFGLQMTRSLSMQYPRVKVVMNDLYDPNQPPVSVGYWLSAVEHYGGKVSIEIDPRYEGPYRKDTNALLFGLVSIVVQAADAYFEERPDFQAAQGYDAVVFYQPANRNQNALTHYITDVDFVRKP